MIVKCKMEQRLYALYQLIVSVCIHEQPGIHTGDLRKINFRSVFTTSSTSTGPGTRVLGTEVRIKLLASLELESKCLRTIHVPPSAPIGVDISSSSLSPTCPCPLIKCGSHRFHFATFAAVEDTEQAKQQIVESQTVFPSVASSQA